MGIKYVRNTDDATIVCKIPSDKNKSFVFRAKKFDKRENILLSNGYTEISDEDLALLRAESSAFRYYEKSKKLTCTDNLPQESMSTEQLIAALRTEIALLKSQAQPESSSKELKNALTIIGEQKEEIEKLKAELDKVAVAGPDDSLLAEKIAEIDILKEENQNLQDIIDGLNEQIIDMADKEETADKEVE